MASTIGAIIGGLLLGGGSGYLRSQSAAKFRADEMERQLILKSLLEATQQGQLGETHRELMRKVMPTKSIDVTYQTLLELSNANRWAMESGADLRNRVLQETGVLGGEEPQGQAAPQGQAPVTGFFPAQTPRALPAPQTPQIGVPAPGQSVDAGPGGARTFDIQVPTPPQFMGAQSVPMPEPPSMAGGPFPGARPAPMPEPPPFAPPPGIPPGVKPVPLPQARVVQVPQTQTPAEPAPVTLAPRPQVIQHLVTQATPPGAKRGLPEGATVNLDLGAGVRMSVTGQAMAKKRGAAILKAAPGSGATVAEVEQALTRAEGEIAPERFKAFADATTAQDYRDTYQALVAKGVDPLMAKTQASRLVFERHGYANSNLPKAFEDAGEMRAALANKVLGWTLDEGVPLGASLDRARRAGFPLTHEDRRGIQAEVFSRRFGELSDAGFVPAEAAFLASIGANGYLPPQFTSAMVTQPSMENMLAMEMFGKPATRLDSAQMGQLRQRVQREQAGQVGRESFQREYQQREAEFAGKGKPGEIKMFPGARMGQSQREIAGGTPSGGGGGGPSGGGGGGAPAAPSGAPAQAPRGGTAPKVPVEDPFEVKPGVPYSEPSAKQVEADTTRAATMRQSIAILRQFEQAKPQISPASENLKINEVRRWFDAMGTDEVTFRSNVDALNQQAIYELTGAQLSIKEMYLRYKWLPKLEDTPKQFLANMRGLQARVWVKHEEDAKARQQAGVRPPQRIPPPPDPKVAYRIFRDSNYSHEQALELMRRYGFEVK